MANTQQSHNARASGKGAQQASLPRDEVAELGLDEGIGRDGGDTGDSRGRDQVAELGADQGAASSAAAADARGSAKDSVAPLGVAQGTGQSGDKAGVHTDQVAELGAGQGMAGKNRTNPGT